MRFGERRREPTVHPVEFDRCSLIAVNLLTLVLSCLFGVIVLSGFAWHRVMVFSVVKFGVVNTVVGKQPLTRTMQRLNVAFHRALDRHEPPMASSCIARLPLMSYAL